MIKDSSVEPEKQPNNVVAEESSSTQEEDSKKASNIKASNILADKISNTVINRFEEKNKHINNMQQISQLKDFLKKENTDVDSSFTYAKHAHPEHFKNVKDLLSSNINELPAEKAHELASSARLLLDTEKRMESALKKSDEKKEEKPIGNNFTKSTMANISGKNVPASSSLDSSEMSDEDIEENFPSSQAHISHINDSGRRVSDIKNWASAEIDELKGGNKRNATAYMTLTPDRMKIMKDLSDDAKKDPLYRPRIISKQTFNTTHGLSATPWDKQSTIEDKKRADQEISKLIGEDISREKIPDHLYSMSA